MAPVNSDRNLLFGLLALQVGLIDQGQLVAAFQAWTRVKGNALADHFIDRGDLDTDQRGVIEAVVGLHVKKHGGDVEKSLAAVSVYKSTLESLLLIGGPAVEATLTRVGSAPAADTIDYDGTRRTGSCVVGSSTSDGQRFRVLRPHAKGGLGAVFVALDSELNREVALKQILDQHADDRVSRHRFLVEAEITGGLEHPGIVPVYGLGAHEGGRPYYAMRFIRGDTLQEAINEFHERENTKSPSHVGGPGQDEVAARAASPSRDLALRKLLRQFTDVCNAIEYAHSRGILHRDIKPSNVIVGRHGETLVVDWGLAKATGKSEPDSLERTLIPQSGSGSSETLPGSALGTPAYMSPEQASGDLDRVGPLSDVYSLGATLYCLLTGKAPYEGNAFEVIRQVQKGNFAKPRQLDPSIDTALEAVCLKAMATEPDNRYTDCRALADDIERWAADETVSAFREPLSRRARRWAKRNRTVVTGLGAAMLVATAGLAAVLAVQSKANAALAAKNSDLASANGRVRDRFNLAHEAIRSFQAGVSEEEMLKGPQFKGLRDKLLRSAAGFYQKLEGLLTGHPDRRSRSMLAEAYNELGELTEKIGVQTEALALQRKSTAIRRELAAAADAEPEAPVDLASTLIAVGKLDGAVGDTAAASRPSRRPARWPDRKPRAWGRPCGPEKCWPQAFRRSARSSRGPASRRRRSPRPARPWRFGPDWLPKIPATPSTAAVRRRATTVLVVFWPRPAKRPMPWLRIARLW